MKLLFKSVTLLALIGILSALAFGQSGAGSLSGDVKDQTGAVVANAKVTIVDKDTQLSRASTTSSSGTYEFSGLKPGTYQLSVSATGFAVNEQQVQVTVGSKLELNVTLGVAGSGNVVEVVGAGGAQVNTVDQEVSSVVSSKEVVDLPTLTRNPYDLVATAANVQEDSQAGVGDARGAGFAINGQRSASTSILLDGAENVDQYTATVGQPIPLDSVQEFRVVTNGMTAEYGRAAGGVVNVATKSGTNAFHGTAYEFNRISALASNTYNNAANDISKPTFTRNQFGFSIGGPIVKNKLFFFNNTEWIRVRSQGAQLTQVLDPAFLPYANANTQAFYAALGKLRPDLVQKGVLTIADVAADPNGFTPGPLLSTVPATTPLLDLVNYNAPSDSGGGAPQNTLMEVARVDYNLSDKTQMFGRYSLYDESDFAGYINTSPFAGYETGQTNFDQNVMFSLTHTFSNTVVSNSRLVWSRLNNKQPLGVAPVGPTLYTRNNVVPRVAGNLFAQPGYSEYTPGNAIPFGGPQNLAQAYEDVSVARGTHTFRFGGQYIYTQDNRVFGAYEEAVEALGNSTAGAFEGLMSGTLQVFQSAVYPQGKYPCPVDLTTGAAIKSPSCLLQLPVGQPSFSRSNLYNDFAIYGQDTWKVGPRLTLDLGLRWEYFGVQHNRDPNLDSNFYNGTGNDLFTQIRTGYVTTAPQSPIGGLWGKRWRNFGPRIGFAYDVFGDGKLALRGGYGISYERNFNNVTYNVIQNPPNYGVLALTPANLGAGATIPISVDNAGPLGGNTGSKYLGPVSLRNVSDNIKTAYVEQYNLGFEKQMWGNAVASVGYNGARGIHQYGISNYNDPGYAPLYLGDTVNSFLNPQYSAINNRGSIGDSWYNAFVAGLRGRIKGVQMNASYTWAHSIDDLSSTFSDEVQNNGLGYLDPFNVSRDKGSSDYDARQRFSVSAVWDLPWGNNSSSGLVRQVIGGWQFAPIFTYHTGYPYTVFDCTNSGAFYNCPRGDVTSAYNPKGGSTDGADTGGNFFNYQTFPIAQGQYGGPAVIPGTTTAFPNAGFNSTLPTCTGLYHQGCSYPANMLSRNSMVGPGNWNWNLGVYKNFKVTERVSLQFRAEFYDVTNHKNFYLLGFGQGGADASVSSDPNAYTVQTKKGGYGNPFDDHRNTQLALKVIF